MGDSPDSKKLSQLDLCNTHIGFSKFVLTLESRNKHVWCFIGSFGNIFSFHKEAQQNACHKLTWPHGKRGSHEHHWFLSQCHVKLKVILKLHGGKTVDEPSW